jgi:hypothetical protein
MKLADLPSEVLDDLSNEQKWRLDIDPGFDAKHEFWMSWRHFLTLSSQYSRFSENPEDQLAEFLNFQGYNVLIPVPRTHHPDIQLIRLIPSADQLTLTLFLHDSFHKACFEDSWGARYGFLAVADRYLQFGCDFYIASYYHFCHLLNQDYQAAQRIMSNI